MHFSPSHLLFYLSVRERERVNAAISYRCVRRKHEILTLRRQNINIHTKLERNWWGCDSDLGHPGLYYFLIFRPQHNQEDSTRVWVEILDPEEILIDLLQWCSCVRASVLFVCVTVVYVYARQRSQTESYSTACDSIWASNCAALL